MAQPAVWPVDRAFLPPHLQIDIIFYVHFFSYSGKETETSRVYNIKLGDPIVSVLTFRNDTKYEYRTVDIVMNMNILDSEGPNGKIVSHHKRFILAPNQQEQLTLRANGSDYVPRVKEKGEIVVNVMANVVETSQIYAKRDLFMIRRPELVLKTNPEAQVNSRTTMTIFFSNPTSQVLTNCNLKVECSGKVTRELKIPQRLAPDATMELQYSIIPRRKGQRSLMAVFNADQAANIRGTCVINVV